MNWRNSYWLLLFVLLAGFNGKEETGVNTLEEDGSCTEWSFYKEFPIERDSITTILK